MTPWDSINLLRRDVFTEITTSKHWHFHNGATTAICLLISYHYNIWHSVISSFWDVCVHVSRFIKYKTTMSNCIFLFLFISILEIILIKRNYTASPMKGQKMSNVRNLLRHSSECTRGGPEVLDKTNGGGITLLKTSLKDLKTLGVSILQARHIAQNKENFRELVGSVMDHTSYLP